jgi:hypothetical protein
MLFGHCDRRRKSAHLRERLFTLVKRIRPRMTPISKKEQHRNRSRQEARNLLQRIVSGEGELYVGYKQLWRIWAGHNSAVPELRPLFRMPGVDPDGVLSINAEFEASVRNVAAQVLNAMPE